MDKRQALSTIAQAEGSGMVSGTCVAQHIGRGDYEIVDVTECMSTDEYLNWLSKLRRG